MEIINSFFNNIKDKLTNPFFGTLILVLIIHHWQLWYATINFDNDCTLDDKLIFIKSYINNHLTLKCFIWDMGSALLYMVIGYLIIVATRSLVLWIEFWLMPFITGKIVNKKVVRRSEYDDVVKEREQYFDQYEEQRKNVRSFSKTIDEQTEQIKQKDEALLDQSEKISSSVRELDQTKLKLEKSIDDNNKAVSEIKNLTAAIKQLQNVNNEIHLDLKNKIKRIEKYEHLFFDDENREFYSDDKNFPPEVINKVTELKREKKWNLFLALGNFYEYGGSIGGEVLTEMIKEDLAFDRESREGLTPLGKVIYKYRKVFDTSA